jgi:nucleotide-binding universal stress UspA family protein
VDMRDFQRILFPVDFSQRCTATAPAVAAFARQFDANVTLLYSLDVPTELEEALHSQSLAQAESLESHTRRRLETYLADVLPAPAERVTLIGKAASNIVRFASSEACDLIMMPTHGHSRFRQLLLGSVTAAVLHDAECPVWTSAHAETSPIPEQCRSIVCAIDLGKNTVSVLERARRMAKAWAATLHVIHAVPAIDPRFESSPAQRAHDFLVMSAEEKYPVLAKQAGLEVELEIVEHVKLGGCIAEGCRRHHSDLLVIGRGAIQGVLGRLRSSAHEIIRSAPCPVLSI